MPVSSPSYFPPNRANGTIVGITAGETTTGARNFLAGKSAGTHTSINDLIVIGDSALSVGTASAPVTDSAAGGSIAIGNNAAKAYFGTNGQAGTAPVTVIGFNAALALQYGYENVIVGDYAYSSELGFNGVAASPAHGMVVIGSQAGRYLRGKPGNYQQAHDSIIVGSNCFPGFSAAANITTIQSVLIGAGALTSAGNNGNASSSIAASVIIGFNALANTGGGVGLGPLVAIGANCGGTLNDGATGNAGLVLIGDSSDCAVSTATNSVIIGSGAKGSGNNNIVIGQGAKIPDNGATHSNTCLVLGVGAGTGSSNSPGDNQFLVEMNFSGVSGPIEALLFGNFADGSIVFGNSIHGTNRDLPGTNVLKLITGTKTGTPLGGGMFYVTGANNDVHWVGSDGTDTNIIAGANGALTYTYNAPLTGFAITVGDDIAQLVLEPAGTLATGTVTLPAAPEDGDTVGISTTQTITALTISPNTGQTVADAPTTLGVGGAVRFLYRSANTTWYRIGN